MLSFQEPTRSSPREQMEVEQERNDSEEKDIQAIVLSDSEDEEKKEEKEEPQPPEQTVVINVTKQSFFFFSKKKRNEAKFKAFALFEVPRLRYVLFSSNPDTQGQRWSDFIRQQ